MESKNTLSIKRHINELGTQHNKLTTLVIALVGEIDKLKREIVTLKTLSNLSSSNTVSEIDTCLDTKNIKVIGNTSSDSERRAEDILKQLSVQELSK